MCGQGQVLEVRGTQVKLLGKDASELCFGCMNMECKGHNHVFTAENPQGLTLETDRLVEVEIPRRNSAAEAGTALLIPILAFLSAYFLVPLFFENPQDALRIALSFLGLVIAAFGVFLVKKFSPAGRLPRIIRVLS
jgi:positive regulator of sigma E activity